jgi:hypothetical protein
MGGAVAGRGRFVGIGIDLYDGESLPNLDHAVADVTAVGERLAGEFDGAPLTNVGFVEADQHLESARARSVGSSLVLMWSGHGVDRGSELRLDRPRGFRTGDQLGSLSGR